MTWEMRLLDLFDDLEQQAEGLSLRARDAEVADLVARSTRRSTLPRGCTPRSDPDHPRDARRPGAWPARACRGRLVPGDSRSGPRERRDAVRRTPRARPQCAQCPGRAALRRGSAGPRLSPALDRWDSAPVAVWDVCGEVHHGTVRRVGADFIELDDAGRAVAGELIPFWAVCWSAGSDAQRAAVSSWSGGPRPRPAPAGEHGSRAYIRSMKASSSLPRPATVLARPV